MKPAQILSAPMHFMRKDANFTIFLLKGETNNACLSGTPIESNPPLNNNYGSPISTFGQSEI